MATPEHRGQDAGEENSYPLPAKKLQKAGRERLRRDHLNEQFAKLADALDPVRPKIDKGTILAESVLALNDLRSEIARLKSEHIALSDESRDLSQEKSELQEEKAFLETEIDRLQDQRNETADNQSSLTGWRMDHPGLMANSQFPYPLMPSIMKSSLSSKDIPLYPDPNQTHHTPVSPFFSVAPFSTFLHPACQVYGMFGSKPPPYMSYTHFSHPGHHTHVERPAARYPALIHPTPKYPAPVPTSAQDNSVDLPIVVTDLQLQTPGLTPSLTVQQSVYEHEQREKSARKGRALDLLGDSGISGSNVASVDEQLDSQLPLCSDSMILSVIGSRK